MKDFFPDKEPRELRERLIIPVAVLLLVFLVMIGRIWYLQIMQSNYYVELARNNRIRLIKSDAPRGLIFDRFGVRIAENRPGFDLMIVPEDVKDWEATKKTLTRLVEIKTIEIEERLEKAKKRPPFEAVTLKGDLSWEEMVRVESAKFKLPGVILSVGPKRTYTSKEASAHLVGYLGEISERELRKFSESGLSTYRRGDMVGKYGIEKSFEKQVRGTGGGRHVEVDVLGREIRTLRRYPPTPGNNLHLTIDIKTQKAAFEAMDGRAGAVCAMDPRTGEILALVSTPGFNPDELTLGVTKEEWKKIVSNPMNILTNRAIQGQYPPASTFKLITAAAALEEGIVSPSKKILSGPAYNFAGRDYRDWKKGGHGEINIHRAIVESSDTFFYQVGLSLGIDNISDYAKWFGLGSRTEIDLDNEKSGLVPSNAWKKKRYGERWYKGETISVSVGQGFLLATPLQMASAFSAIANGGTIYKPILVKKITSHDGELIERFEPEKKSKLPISSTNLAILKRALRGVVNEEGGTARGLMDKDIHIAGKTGTAQVVSMKERIKDIETIPYKFRDHGWFVGFAPYDDPQIVVSVLIEHGGFGSRSAAPVALKVIKSFLETRDEETNPLEKDIEPEATPETETKEVIPSAEKRETLNIKRVTNGRG